MTPGLASSQPAVSKIKQLGMRVQLTLQNASTFTTFKPSKKYIFVFKAFINFSFRSSNIAEGVVLLILSSLIIPANALAIYQFYRMKINRTFFTLVTALCFCNFGMAIVGFENGVAKFTTNHQPSTSAFLVRVPFLK